MSTLTKLKKESSSNYHHGNLRDSLIIAGLEILESTQSTEFSLRELTRQVGVTANAIYRHFANKEELLTAMAVEGFRKLINAQGIAVQTCSKPAESFLAAGKAYIIFACHNPTLFRLMYGRFSSVTEHEEVKTAAQFAYDAMRYSLAIVLGKPADEQQVIVASIHAWSVIHGLSHLIIDGQVDRHVTNIEDLINAVMQQTLPLLTLRKSDKKY
ncbi:WHG domain-containing protein [Acinetobacter sp. ANC 3882]|uniref:TetR/AcrR family transcriptional regulator n=1 Tax=Acinetobacter sp. ANC 3882 TaxID=2923423 RepID=UPI001F4B1FE3|nr:WHG domain-containing protein [Acinetobacter sp. ANC 3882]